MRRLFFADVLLFVRKFCIKNEKKKENSENFEKSIDKRDMLRYNINVIGFFHNNRPFNKSPVQPVCMGLLFFFFLSLLKKEKKKKEKEKEKIIFLD